MSFLKKDEKEHSDTVEQLCAQLILSDFKEHVKDVRLVSTREDMFLHYDRIVELIDGGELRLEIKGLKSLGGGRQKTGDFHWIETKNVSGAKGWVYGSADLFAFQVGEQEFIFVTTKSLLELTKKILEEMEDKKVHRTDPQDLAERYVKKRLFTRYKPEFGNERRDETFLIETKDLKEISVDNPFKQELWDHKKVGR